MTEYEIADLALSTQAILWQQLQMAQGMADRISNFVQSFSNLLFGYLIVSYFVGAQLTRVQSAILTALYLFWQVRLGVAIYAVVINSKSVLREIRKNSPDLDLAVPALTWLLFLMSLLSLASIYFMWSVRHPKTD